MNHDIRTLIESHVSVNYYDPARPVPDALVSELARKPLSQILSLA